MYLANSAAVDASLTECTLTVVTGAGESSEIVCSPPMLDTTKYEIEQSQPQNNPRTDPDPMRNPLPSPAAWQTLLEHHG